jgi:hypothetical protein
MSKFRIGSCVLGLSLVGCTEYELKGQQYELGGDDTALLQDDTASATPVDPSETAAIQGRVCNTNGGDWVVGADVYIIIDSDGDGIEDYRIETSTDGDGFFTLEDVPMGTHTVYVEKGSFSTQFEVLVDEPGAVELADEECLDATDVEIAVITGAYDSIGDILDELGMEYTRYNGLSGQVYIQLLTDLSEMEQYDIIFLNCGISDGWINSQGGVIGSNIKSYVEGGGSIYSSDWAFYFFEKGFPDAADFYGEDSRVDSARVGAMGNIMAEVLDANMQLVLGSNVADLYYDLGSWAVAEGVDSSTTEVLLRGTANYEDYLSWDFGSVPNSPLAIRFEKGGGTAIYTSFHNERQATVDMTRLLEEIILSL